MSIRLNEVAKVMLTHVCVFNCIWFLNNNNRYMSKIFSSIPYTCVKKIWVRKKFFFPNGNHGDLTFVCLFVVVIVMMIVNAKLTLMKIWMLLIIISVWPWWATRDFHKMQGTSISNPAIWTQHNSNNNVFNEQWKMHHFEIVHVLNKTKKN